LVDPTIIPLRGGRHISDEVTEVIKLIDASRLPYQLTPSGTCIEGEWEIVMPLIQRCHHVVRSMSSHVVTFIKIEDDPERTTSSPRIFSRSSVVWAGQSVEHRR
jgi:uncharacterized protein YqgV (UPF0045/DUF77 family)